ncbi:hypothetical protein [Xanthomonas albilineans]|uniref:hypothetical protein n=1 Tax=Xanthomonas albilineans TaxID=29447 RepID=UPI001E465310|nr:hypothetical protein [Xanthomonas albilineans]
MSDTGDCQNEPLHQAKWPQHIDEADKRAHQSSGCRSDIRDGCAACAFQETRHKGVQRSGHPAAAAARLIQQGLKQTLPDTGRLPGSSMLRPFQGAANRAFNTPLENIVKKNLYIARNHHAT